MSVYHYFLFSPCLYCTYILKLTGANYVSTNVKQLIPNLESEAVNLLPYNHKYPDKLDVYSFVRVFVLPSGSACDRTTVILQKVGLKVTFSFLIA